MIVPPREYQTFAGLPWRWWRRIPHLHIAVFLPETGIMCCICWRPWSQVRP